MLRALTSYFFGGIQDETPEAPIECETREVNDWLVVNLPDHNKDSINLNDDDEDNSYEIDDEDIRNDEMDDDDTIEVDASDLNEMDLYDDEDDILMSLSILMMPPEEEKPSSNEPHYDYRSFQEKSFERQISRYPFSLIPSIFKGICQDIEHKQLFDTYTRLLNIGRQAIVPVQPISQEEQTDRMMREQVLDMVVSGRFLGGSRKDIVNEFVRKDKVVNVQVIDITPPPAHYKSYVDHRHPEKVLNYDILQRIKELEPEQHAAQRSIRKNLTRGQMNRQNKNYMYEASSKRNRRCNRQRVPSGANNNRKCC